MHSSVSLLPSLPVNRLQWLPSRPSLHLQVSQSVWHPWRPLLPRLGACLVECLLGTAHLPGALQLRALGSTSMV